MYIHLTWHCKLIYHSIVQYIMGITVIMRYYYLEIIM